jgi:hypothetical protein
MTERRVILILIKLYSLSEEICPVPFARGNQLRYFRRILARSPGSHRGFSPTKDMKIGYGIVIKEVIGSDNLKAS